MVLIVNSVNALIMLSPDEEKTRVGITRHR